MTQTNERIIEKKICHLSKKEFLITDRDRALLDACAPVIGGKTIALPNPTCSPITRAQRRMAFRNERYLYKRKSCFTGKEIVTMFHPDDPRPVCETKLWHSDDWSPFDHGRDIDFSKTFFDQFRELWSSVPTMALYHTGECENCTYTNWFGGGNAASKNCYLCFNGGEDEDCMFTKGVIRCRDCLEMYQGTRNERCYECVNCHECFGTAFSQDCTNCRSCIECRACIGCENCFGCTNLANASYRIFNEQLTENTYKERVNQLRITHETRATIEARGEKEHRRYPVRNNRNMNCENCAGDYLFNCKDTIGSEASDCENVRYVNMSKLAKDSMDIAGFGYYADHMLEALGSGQGSRILFTHTLERCSDSMYSAWCLSCNHVFGSCGIKSSNYVVCNRAYAKHEYESLVLRIIAHMQSTGEWGEYFPASMSPFGFNETIGYDAYPLTREEVIGRGWNWYDMPEEVFEGERIAPLDIREYDERIVGVEKAKKNIDVLLKGVVVCEISGKPFRITPEELLIYIDRDLPIPRRHPNVRYDDRLKYLAKKIVYEVHCSKCQTPISTTYSPLDKRDVVCEECYRKLVY